MKQDKRLFTKYDVLLQICLPCKLERKLRCSPFKTASAYCAVSQELSPNLLHDEVTLRQMAVSRIINCAFLLNI